MKKIMLATIVTIAAVSGFIGYFNLQTNQQLSALTLANIEALTGTNEALKYDSRDENTVAIWDEASGTYKSITTIICSGKGEIVCPCDFIFMLVS